MPVVFFTGSHFNWILVRVFFATLGASAFGSSEPPLFVTDANVFKCVKNVQLALQLFDAF